MFNALRQLLPHAKKDFIQVTNQQKKEDLIKYLRTHSTSELEGVLSALKTHISMIDPERDDFDAYCDKLIFGHALFARCFEEEKYRSYAFSAYPVIWDDLMHAMPWGNDIDRIVRLGELILEEKKFPLTEELIKFYSLDADYADYLVQRFAQYDTMDFDAQVPVFIRKELRNLWKKPAKQVFDDIDINGDEFDYLMMGAITCALAVAQNYPLTIDELSERVGVKSVETHSDFKTLFLEVGRKLFDEKSLPIGNLFKLSGPHYLKYFAAKRCNQHQHLNLSNYLSKQLVRELCDSLPYDTVGLLDEVTDASPEYNYLVTGLAIYAMVLNDDYPIARGRFFQHCGIEDEYLEQQLLTIGKLALDEKVIPLGTFYPEKSLCKRFGNVSKFTSEFFDNRVKKYKPKSSRCFLAQDKLIALLPPEAQDISMDIARNSPQSMPIVCGAIIYLMASQSNYPISVSELHQLCGDDLASGKTNYKKMFFELGQLALVKQRIPFDKYEFESMEDLTEAELKELVDDTPLSYLVNKKYTAYRELYDRLHIDLKRNSVIYPVDTKRISNSINYIFGLYVFALAEHRDYLFSKEELIAQCYQKPMHHNLYGYFSADYASSQPATVQEYDKLFIEIGERILHKKSLPFGTSVIKANSLGLSDDSCEFLMRFSDDQRFMPFAECDKKRCKKVNADVVKPTESVAALEIKVPQSEAKAMRFFSKANAMQVSREDLTDEAMAKYYQGLKRCKKVNADVVKPTESVAALEIKVPQSEAKAMRFFSKANAMQVSREDLTDEAMAKYYQGLNR